MPIIKKKSKNNKIKYYIFGLPILKIQKSGNYRKIYLLGLNIFKYYYKEKQIIKNEQGYKQLYIQGFSLFKNKNIQQKDKVAVFGILPPKTSGIALYTYKTFTVVPKIYDIFSEVEDINIYNKLLKNSENIYPIGMYDYLNIFQKYKSQIYILGNSDHHKEILKKAIETKNISNRWLYLHEAMLLWGIFPTFGDDFATCLPLVKESYPEYYEVIKNFNDMGDIYKFLSNKNYGGVRILIDITKIQNIIVNNNIAKNLIINELTEEQRKIVNIKVVFLPIEELNVKKIDLKNENCTIIGSFGIPQEAKQTDLLIEAVKLLNDENDNKYKLLLAGYGVFNYLENNNIHEKFILPYDSPNSEYLYRLMASVNLAVQLRKNPRGESSGCISQLLSLNQKIITTDGFVSEYGYNCCNTVSKNITARELAQTIKRVHYCKQNYNSSILIEKFSFKKLSELIYKEII